MNNGPASLCKVNNMFAKCISMIIAKRNILGHRRDYWGLLEGIDRLIPDAHEIASSIKNLPGIK